jgi:hypothetical protein
MVKPLVVSIPHQLGKEEAVRRLKAGLASARTQYASLIKVDQETWTGDRLDFGVTAMAQQVSGTIDVAEDHVRLEVVLPWLLARLASNVQDMVRKRGTLLLEKK